MFGVTSSPALHLPPSDASPVAGMGRLRTAADAGPPTHCQKILQERTHGVSGHLLRVVSRPALPEGNPRLTQPGPHQTTLSERQIPTHLARLGAAPAAASATRPHRPPPPQAAKAAAPPPVRERPTGRPARADSQRSPAASSAATARSPGQPLRYRPAATNSRRSHASDARLSSGAWRNPACGSSPATVSPRSSRPAWST